MSFQRSRKRIFDRFGKSLPSAYFDYTADPKGITVEYRKEYYAYQDQGVSGAVNNRNRKSPFKYRDKMPPSSAFDKWSIKVGIAPRDEKGRFVSRQSINFAIARSIYINGIPAKNYVPDMNKRVLRLHKAVVDHDIKAIGQQLDIILNLA